MIGFQKMGGVAALVQAATFVVGFVLLLAYLEPADYGSADIGPDEHAAFLAENQTIMYIWYLAIYVVFGIFLVVLALALHDRLKTASHAIMRVATAFGLIWAGLVIASGMVANIGVGVIADLYGREPGEAASLWLALDVVVNGLGGGNEIVGGLWVVLTSLAAFRTDALPKALTYVGIIAGVAGILTVIPLLEMLGAVFGLGLIVWFAWLGVVMLRGKPASAVSDPARSMAAT